MPGMTDLAAFIRSLPKAELHVHLEGCITPEQLVALGRRNGIDTFESVEAARAAYDVSTLDDFLEIFAMASAVLLHAEDFAEVASAYFDSVAAEGVRTQRTSSVVPARNAPSASSHAWDLAASSALAGRTL
jgi:adenosine deaminase